jgi:ABC-2 type transport system permease protein
VADVSPWLSLLAVALFLVLCLGAVWAIFRTGYRIKS